MEQDSFSYKPFEDEFQISCRLEPTEEKGKDTKNVLRLELEHLHSKVLWLADILDNDVTTLTKYAAENVMKLLKLLRGIIQDGWGDYSYTLTKKEDTFILTISHHTRIGVVSFDILFYSVKVAEVERLEKMIKDLQQQVRFLKAREDVSALTMRVEALEAQHYEKPSVYSLKVAEHTFVTTTAEWKIVPGLEKKLTVQKLTDILVLTHCHGNPLTTASRLDVKVFVDNQPCGNFEDSRCHTPTWLPVISIASTTLSPGTHSIDTRVRNGASNGGQVYANGHAMLIVAF